MINVLLSQNFFMEHTSERERFHVSEDTKVWDFLKEHGVDPTTAMLDKVSTTGLDSKTFAECGIEGSCIVNVIRIHKNGKGGK